MTPRTFFTIFIKVLGIYLLIDSLTVIPQSFSLLYATLAGFYDGIGGFQIALTLFMLFLILGVYYLIFRFCIYKTDWIIDRFALDKNFEEEKIEVNIHRSTILRISVIVIGGLIFIDTFPSLCKSIFTYFKTQQTGDVPYSTFQSSNNPVTSYLLFYFVKTLIGYFMITSSRLIVNFIERQRQK